MAEHETIFDVEDALQRIRGNQKLLTMLLQMFLTGEEGAKLEASLDAGDYAQAADLSHAIKGVAGNLSLTALQHAVAALNNELKEGACAPATLETYRRTLAETRAEAQRYLDSNSGT